MDLLGTASTEILRSLGLQLEGSGAHCRQKSDTNQMYDKQLTSENKSLWVEAPTSGGPVFCVKYKKIESVGTKRYHWKEMLGLFAPVTKVIAWEVKKWAMDLCHRVKCTVYIIFFYRQWYDARRVTSSSIVTCASFPGAYNEKEW